MDDNDSLRLNINDIESKNRSLVTTLDKNIAERAREYKERTVERLTSPRNHPARGRDHQERAAERLTSPRNKRYGAHTSRERSESNNVEEKLQTRGGLIHSNSVLRQLNTKVFDLPKSNSPSILNETPGKF